MTFSSAPLDYLLNKIESVSMCKTCEGKPRFFCFLIFELNAAVGRAIFFELLP
jgi:hypothetical protein